MGRRGGFTPSLGGCWPRGAADVRLGGSHLMSLPLMFCAFKCDTLLISVGFFCFKEGVKV